MTGAVKLQNFLGMTPIVDNTLLPQGAASYALNAWLYSGVLNGYRPKTAIHTNLLVTTKSVYRIPLNMADKPGASFANSTWMEFADEFVDVLRTPVVDDLYARYYWARPGSVPQYNTLARIQAGSPPYTLGIPAPSAAPTVTAPVAPAPVAPAALTSSESPIEQMYICYFDRAASPDVLSYWAGQYAAGTTLAVIAQAFGASGGATTSDGGALASPASLYPFLANWTSTVDLDRLAFIIKIFNVLFNRAPTGTTNTLELGQWNTTLTNYQNTLTGSALANATYKLIWDIAVWGTGADATVLANKTTVGGYFTNSLKANSLPFTGAAATLAASCVQATSDAASVTAQETAINNYVANPTGSSAPVTEVRAYVYTWLSTFGEEGPPSPPTIGTGLLTGNWTIGITAPAAGDTTNRTLAKQRIYRTVTASTGITTFYFVAEQNIGTTVFTDGVTDTIVAGNALLASTNWFHPSISMQGMVVMPNGIFAGWSDNNIYFTEPYRPHAWPAQYTITTDFPIIGMGVVGQTLVVCTEGNATAVTGVHPATMTETKLSAFEPCVSRGSIVSSQSGVIYMSPHGLIMVTANGSTNATSALVDKRTWTEQVDPYNMKAVRHGSAYMALHAPVAAPTTGFLVDTSMVAAPTGQYMASVKESFCWLSDDQLAQNFQTDPWTGEIFLVTNSTVYWFDPIGATTINPYVWTSKLFQLNKVDNLAACKIYFTVPSGTAAQNAQPNNTLGQSLGANQYGILDVYADGVLVASQEIWKSGDLIRLPSGFRRMNWQFRITARVVITNLQIASSVKELSSV